MNNNKYWYGLKSEVYVHIRNDKALAYDTQHNICHLSEDRHVVDLLKRVELDESTGCVLIDENWQFPSVQKWIHETCAKKMAVKIPFISAESRPVILRPLLSLNKDMDKIADINHIQLFFGESVKHFFNSLTIYINASCTHHCIRCKDYCRQIPFCTNFGEGRNFSISPQQLATILKEVEAFPLRHINILGGNIYDEIALLQKLQEAARQIPVSYRFYVHYAQYQKNSFVDGQNLHLLIPAHFDACLLEAIYEQLLMSDTTFHFVIESENDVKAVDNFVNNNHVKSYQMHPFYTGHNEAFFIQNVYMKKEDLVHTKLCMREIFRNQKLNANNFGALYIMPDGSIRARTDSPALGYVGEDKLVDVIHKELTDNTAWRRVRCEEPCSQCVFQYICPPPSGYESAIGKNNLCYMRINKTIV